MKIGIDARLIHETGVGRYIRNLLDGLAQIHDENDYVVFLQSKDIPGFRIPDRRWKTVPVDVRWHTLKEQLVMPNVCLREKLDVLHIPYFNVPVIYPGRFIVTIHDLTIMDIRTGKASTLPRWVYSLKRLGYLAVVAVAMYRSTHILTVSETVKQEIVRRFRIPGKKVSVTLEGIDSEFTGSQQIREQEKNQHGHYFLYVGNVFPHKNIDVLLDAFTRFMKQHQDHVSLIFAGPDDYFYRQLRTLVTSLDLGKHVRIRNNVSDSELRTLYANAVALVFPSRKEGFGLPALEALASGCRVIASDIPIFREILKNHAYFADTTDPESLSRVMNEVYAQKFDRSIFSKQLVPFLSSFSWSMLTKQTHEIYLRSAS